MKAITNDRLRASFRHLTSARLPNFTNLKPFAPDIGFRKISVHVQKGVMLHTHEHALRAEALLECLKYAVSRRAGRKRS